VFASRSSWRALVTPEPPAHAATAKVRMFSAASPVSPALASPAPALPRGLVEASIKPVLHVEPTTITVPHWGRLEEPSMSGRATGRLTSSWSTSRATRCARGSSAARCPRRRPSVVRGDARVEVADHVPPERVVGDHPVDEQALHLGDVVEPAGHRPRAAEHLDIVEVPGHDPHEGVAIEVLVATARLSWSLDRNGRQLGLRRVSGCFPPVGWRRFPPVGWRRFPPVGWRRFPPVGWRRFPPGLRLG
jgi:hypothetical protein